MEKVLTAAGADRRRQGHPEHPDHGAQRAAGARPRHRRLVRARPAPADHGRRDRPLLQHRHRARGDASSRPSSCGTTSTSSASASAPTSACPARPAACCPQPADWSRADPGPDRLRPGPLGQRAPDGRGGQHPRQRRRAGHPEPGPGPRPPRPPAARSAPTPPPAPRGQRARPPARPPQMMELVTTPDVGTAPGAGIEGYRVAGKTGTAQEVGGECNCYADGGTRGLLRRLRPGRQAALHRLRRGQEAARAAPAVAAPPARCSARSSATCSRSTPCAPTGTPPSTLPTKWGRGAERSDAIASSRCPS